MLFYVQCSTFLFIGFIGFIGFIVLKEVYSMVIHGY